MNKPDSLLLVLLTISALVNVGMVYRNHRLTDIIEAKQAESRLPAGTKVPELRLIDQTASLIRIPGPTQDEKSTFVYFFSPTCRYCKANIVGLRQLTAGIKNSHRRIALLSKAEDWKTLDSEYGAMFDVIAVADESTRKLLHLGGTPNSVFLSAKGEVLGSSAGWYSKANVDWVKKMTKISVDAVEASD